MSQNLISLTLNDEQLQQADQGLDAVEAAFGSLIALHGEERTSFIRMGAKSEQFARQTLGVLHNNPQIIPPSVNLAEAQADLLAIDRLRPRLQRLIRLVERAQDTESALGSDVMSLALEGYALLKISGKNQGLEALRKELGSRFAKTRGAEPEPAGA